MSEYSGSGWMDPTPMLDLAAHDAALVAATRRQCAALACAGCRGEWFMHQAKPIEVSRGRWAHLQVTPNEHYCAAECVASAIWALADREPEGSA